MLRVFSNNQWPRQEFPQWDIWNLQADLLFFYSHIANFLNDRCLWLGQPPERTGCTAVWHTLACAHTHTQVRKEREKMRHLMKDGKQVFFLCFGALWVFVGQLWHWSAPVMSFVCASGPNKSLLRNLWEAWAVGKECPLSWSSTLILIIHWRRGAPASGWQEFTHCWPQ